jgi:4-aminobutyrate aminotransferase
VGADWAFGHYTHEKNPLMARAGLTTIEIIEQEGLVARSAELGAVALQRGQILASEFPAIGDVRGRGLMLGIELVNEDGSPNADLAESILYGCLRRGLSFKTTMGNILALAPALTIREGDLHRAFDIIESAFRDPTP